MDPQVLAALTAVIDTIKAGRQIVGEVGGLVQDMRSMRYEAVLRRLGLTAQEAGELLDLEGYLTRDGIRLVMERRGWTLAGEVWGDALCVLRQPPSSILGGILRMRWLKGMRVWYCFTNLSLYLFQDIPSDRARAGYDPVRFRTDLSAINAGSIRFDLTEAPTITPDGDSEHEWYYDNHLFDPRQVLVDEILSARARYFRDPAEVSLVPTAPEPQVVGPGEKLNAPRGRKQKPATDKKSEKAKKVLKPPAAKKTPAKKGKPKKR